MCGKKPIVAQRFLCLKDVQPQKPEGSGICILRTYSVIYTAQADDDRKYQQKPLMAQTFFVGHMSERQ